MINKLHENPTCIPNQAVHVFSGPRSQHRSAATGRKKGRAKGVARGVGSVDRASNGLGVSPGIAHPREKMIPELFVCFWMGLFAGAAHGLKMIKLDIPQVVVLGEETTLTCVFDLEEDTLYSIKWYRDDLEFFRYVPSDRPPNQFFHLPGVDIDLRRSSNGTVYIQDVDVSSAGTYKCEISADAPSFQTVFAEKILTVTIVNDSARIPDPGVLAASFTLLLLCHFTVW